MGLTVVVVANDVIPGSGVPVSAPGLRAAGLAEGLRAHGLETILLAPEDRIGRLWQRRTPHPRPAGSTYLPYADLRDHLGALTPDFVVITNSNQIDRVADLGLPIVLDLFAPRLLEEQHGGATVEQLASLEEEVRRAFAGAVAVAVNGSKKRPWVEDWLDRVGRPDVPVLPTPMAVPVRAGSRRSGAIVAAAAGYRHRWSHDDDLWGRASAALSRMGARLIDLQPTHEEQEDLVTFADFTRTIGAADLLLDVFPHSPERELAMVTRTVVALAAGLPVVHPHFTEVGALVDEWGAGWTYDPRVAGSLEDTIAEAVADRSEVEEASLRATALARAVFDPFAATSELARWLT